MNTKGFIFARGGSKGLPKKNVKELNGKPLIQHSIDVALASPSINAVYVSTENDEIAEIAKSCGATLIPRPAALSKDTSPEWLAWQHAVEWVRRNEEDFDQFVSLPATSPLRNVQDVERAIEKRLATNTDICISVTDANRSPYFNMVKRSESGLVELVCKHVESVARRQDAPEVFDVSTVVYATTPGFVMTHSNIFQGRVSSIRVPKNRAVDIDDIYDFMLAEAIISA